MHVRDKRVITTPQPIVQGASCYDLAHGALLGLFRCRQLFGATLVQELLDERKLLARTLVAGATLDDGKLVIVCLDGCGTPVARRVPCKGNGSIPCRKCWVISPPPTLIAACLAELP